MIDKIQKHKLVCDEVNEFENAEYVRDEKLHIQNTYNYLFNILSGLHNDMSPNRMDTVIIDLAVTSINLAIKTQDGVDRFIDVVDSLHTMYEKKNADYGDSVGNLYKAFGDISMFTRISDKYNRLLSLTKPGAKINYESLEDTYLDMANYCIIWVMERRLVRNV